VAAGDALTDARRDLDDQLLLSPMHELAAAIYGVRASELTEAQFNWVKRFAILGLAGAFASLSAVASLVVHQEPKRSDKLARALRAWLARRRKRLVIHHDVPGPVEFRDRVVVRHVPYSVEHRMKVRPSDARDETQWGQS
jgi:hypothetical protein